MDLKWFELRSEKHGSITIKARYQWEAIQEATDRWNCDEDEIVCVGYVPYYAKSIYN